MFKSKAFWIIAINIILLAAGGGYYFYTIQFSTAEAAASTDPAMQTAVARLGELTIIASGSGQIAAASEINLAFDESGTLIELNVAVGDEVQAGDVLARLQTDSPQEEIDASISDAELEVLRAQASIDDLHASSETLRAQALNDIATYAQEVRDAQYQLENYIMPLSLQGMDTIEALDATKAQLDAASAAFEPVRLLPAADLKRRALLETLNLAQSNYDAAVKRLNYEYVLQVAQANLEKARQDYDKYASGPAADELALAEAELANAQARLALARETQATIDLVAPMDGTVMSLNANVGEAVGTSTFITLADLSQPMVEVYLDETDLDKVAVGNAAEVTFDALPDTTFAGKVTTVSPGLEEVSGVQAIKVLVELGEVDTGISLPVGLNAAVDLIAGQATNAVLVPVEALRDLGSGEYAVFVVEGDQPVMRVVQVGLKDVTSAQIVSGLEAGETVSTGITQTK